jgi:hypothetical protein
VTIASEQNVLGQMSTTPSGDFHPRFSNSIQYWTPKLAGFSGRLDYSANEGKTDTVNPSGLSGALYYDQGPFYAVLATSATTTRVCWSQAREGTTRELRPGSGSDSEVPSGVFDCLRSGPKHALPPVYRPTSGEADYLWPNWPWRQSFAAFDAGERAVNFLDAANSFDAASHARQRTKRVRRGVFKLTVKEGGKE